MAGLLYVFQRVQRVENVGCVGYIPSNIGGCSEKEQSPILEISKNLLIITPDYRRSGAI